jgi:competence protein ComEA
MNKLVQTSHSGNVSAHVNFIPDDAEGSFVKHKLNAYILALSLWAWMPLLFVYVAWPHGGGLDDNGCHHDNKVGEYHCHQGPHAGETFASKDDMLKGTSGQPMDRPERPERSERATSDEPDTAKEKRTSRDDASAEQMEKARKKSRKTDQASKQKSSEKKKSTQDQGVIDINAAALEELESLPGVGAATAKKIVVGRPYRTKGDLVKKDVVSQSTYDSIKDQIVARKKQ